MLVFCRRGLSFAALVSLVGACFNPDDDPPAASETSTGFNEMDTGRGSSSSTMGSSSTTDASSSTSTADSSLESTAVDPDSTTATTGEAIAMCEDGAVAPGELCLGSAAAFAAGDVVFEPRLLDADDDDHLDVVWAIGDSVEFLPGDGTGSFGKPVSDAILAGDLHDAGDVNGDGRADWVYVTSFDNEVGVAVADGNGFTVGDLTGTFDTPTALELVHLDGSAGIDAVVATGGNGFLRVFLANADGNLVAGTGTSAQGQVLSLAHGEFSGNDDPDVAALVLNAGPDYGVVVSFGNGTGGLAAVVPVTAALDEPTTLSAGDIDDDGQDDLVVADQTNLRVLLGTGAAFRETSPIVLSSAADLVSVQDVTQDGFADIVVGYDAVTEIVVIPSLGDGTFDAPVELPLSHVAGSFAYGDANEDGALDVIVGPRSTGLGASETVTVLLSTP